MDVDQARGSGESATHGSAAGGGVDRVNQLGVDQQLMRGSGESAMHGSGARIG